MTFRNDPCKTCGHDRSEHIYEMGACRPGFVCPHGCEFFVSMSPEPKTVTITIRREDAEKLRDGNPWEVPKSVRQICQAMLEEDA